MVILKAFPKALFSLSPINPKAKATTSDPRNEDRAYKILDGGRGGDSTLAIAIGFDIHSRAGNSYTLATLGRGHDVDVYVSGSMISKIQCSFEINLDTKVVLLYDRSTAQTTQVHGENATPFQHTREPPRRVVIGEELNDIITFGGAARDLVQFGVIWHQTLAEALETTDIDDRPQAYMKEVAYNPRVARTLSQEPDTELPSRMDTRTHTPAQMQMRYQRLDPLGSGSFGEVFKALNIDSGKFMAVKRMHIRNPRDYDYARKREVETLARIRHPHILEFIHSEGWDVPDAPVLIFMELKDGSLGSLLKNKEVMGSPQQVQQMAQLVFEQMLQALDFLACHDVIHRDVKPDNILYLLPCGDGGHRFQLGDFGLCNPYNNAHSIVGTPIFAAPERRSGSQTPKFDVWSLMVTMLWTLYFDSFAIELGRTAEEREILPIVMRFASITDFKPIGAMAKVNPAERASAAQLLDRWFGGKGLTTRRKSITPLVD